MKIKHLRDIQRRPFATIVQDDNGHFGVSICNDNDRFNKKLGVTIATGRAMVGSEPHYPNKKVSVAIPVGKGHYDLVHKTVEDHVYNVIQHMKNSKLTLSHF